MANVNQPDLSNEYGKNSSTWFTQVYADLTKAKVESTQKDNKIKALEEELK